MDQRATIAVIMPVYNKRPYIERALASITAQSRAPDEVIVVDDASTDGSMDAVRSFDHPSLRVLRRSQPGQYAARNMAINSAASEWVTFLDADDEWRPTFLAGIDRLIAAAGTEIGCVFTGYEVVEPGARRAAAFARQSTSEAPVELDLDGFLDLWLEFGRTPVCVDVIACRRDLLIEAGMFPEGRCNRGGDVDLWLRLLWRTNALAVPDIGATYYRDPNVLPPSQTLDGSLCLKATVDELLGVVPPATAHRLRRLYDQYAYQYVRRRAGRQRISPNSYAGFFAGADPVRYAATTALASLPAAASGGARKARRAVAGARRLVRGA